MFACFSSQYFGVFDQIIPGNLCTMRVAGVITWGSVLQVTSESSGEAGGGVADICCVSKFATFVWTFIHVH